MKFMFNDLTGKSKNNSGLVTLVSCLFMVAQTTPVLNVNYKKNIAQFQETM